MGHKEKKKKREIKEEKNGTKKVQNQEAKSMEGEKK